MTAFAHVPGLPDEVEVLMNHEATPIGVRIGMDTYALLPMPRAYTLSANESAHPFVLQVVCKHCTKPTDAVCLKCEDVW